MLHRFYCNEIHFGALFPSDATSISMRVCVRWLFVARDKSRYITFCDITKTGYPEHDASAWGPLVESASRTDGRTD